MTGDEKRSPVWETTDLGSAAFVHLKGLAITGVRQREEGVGDFVFMFDDPDSIGRKLQIEYANSECRRYDESVRTLKKLCYDSNPPRRRQRR